MNVQMLAKFILYIHFYLGGGGEGVLMWQLYLSSSFLSYILYIYIVLCLEDQGVTLRDALIGRKKSYYLVSRGLSSANVLQPLPDAYWYTYDHV